MSNWTELTERLKELQTEFVHEAENLEKDKRTRPGVCGSWSPRQVVAHLAGWEKEVIRQFTLFQQGVDKAIGHDIDRFNKKTVRQRAHLGWKETMDELKELHELFYKKAQSISLQEIAANEEYKDWILVQIEHYEHHTRQIRQWV